MSSFNSGFNLGAGMFNAAERNRLAAEELELTKAREARANEEFGWRRDQQTRENDAFNNFSSIAGGVTPQMQTDLKNTYGMNPAQVAQGLQQGGAAGLQARIDSYNAPDMTDLQNVPEGGLQRPQMQFKDPSRMDLEKAMGGLALARRDVQGMRASQTAQSDLQRSEIASKVMAMPRAELEKLVPDLNTSGYPILYTGKGKNGYTFLQTEADGKTPIAGSTFTMNENQLRQMAMAHQLGTAGFGTEAMAALNAAHKDLGDHVAKWNEAMKGAATTNNTATHYGNQDAAEAAKGQYYRDRGAMDRMGSAQYFTGQDGNQYAAIPTMTKQGLQFETVRVNPQGIKLSKMGGTGADGKPLKVEEEGTKMTIGGQLMFADGNGGWIEGDRSGKPVGPLPSERSKALKAAGISDNDVGSLEWTKDGKGVILNGSMKFGLDELKLIPGEIKRLNSSNIAVDEEKKRTLGLHQAGRRISDMEQPQASNTGFGPKITYQPDFRAPSIYAGPEEWEAYRAYQARQQQR